MRKIIVPISDVIILILAGIAFGLGGLTVALQADGVSSMGTYYSLVWPYDGSVNALNLVGFFALCLAPLCTLVSLIPFKFRFISSAVGGILYVLAGVLALMLPSIINNAAGVSSIYYLQGGVWGMAVLLFIAGLFSIINVVIDIVGAKAE